MVKIDMKEEQEVTKLFQRVQLMTDDPLRYLLYPHYYCLGKYFYHICAVKGFFAVYVEIFNVICIIDIYKNDRQIYSKQHISITLIEQYSIVCCILQLYYGKYTLQLPNYTRQFLSSAAAGRDVQAKILREYTSTKKLCVVILVTVLTLHIVHLPLLGDVEEMFFADKFIKKHFGIWAGLARTLYYMGVVSLGSDIINVNCGFVYVAAHLKLQFTLLTELFKKLSTDHKPNTEDIFYQEIIRKRLKFCVKIHSTLKKLSTTFLKIGRGSVAVAFIPACISFAGDIYFMSLDVSLINKCRAISILIMSLAFCFNTARCGQQLQDASNELHAILYECDWIFWNTQNRKTLAIIMVNSSKVIKMSSFVNIVVGNEMLVRMTRTIYSIVVLVINVYQ